MITNQNSKLLGIRIRIINSTQVERTFSTWVTPFVLRPSLFRTRISRHQTQGHAWKGERERSNPLIFFQMDLLPNFYAWICQVPGHKGEKWCLHSLIALGVSSCCNWRLQRLQRLHLLKSKDFHQATYIKASSRCHMLQGQSQAFQHASAPEVGTVDP